MNRSPIEWLAKFNPDGTIAEQGYTVNPIRASPRSNPHRSGHFCVKTSTGCRFCYSSKLQKRFGLPEFGEQASYKIMIEGKHVLGPEDGPTLDVFLDESKLLGILKHKKPCRLFPFDMSDLFGEWVPDEWIDRYFAVAALTPHITHLVLTKRSERMREYSCDIETKHRIAGLLRDQAFADILPLRKWPLHGPTRVGIAEGLDGGWRWPLSNMHLGVSCENQKAADDRIPELLACPAAVRWISVEPCLGPVNLTQWLRGNKIHDRSREGISGTGGDRSILSGFGREDMAAQEDDRRKSDGSPTVLEGYRHQKGGDIGVGRLSDSPVFGRDRAAKESLRTQGCLDAGEQRRPTAPAGDQSQGRDQGEHASVESGTRDAVRKYNSCDSGARQKAKGPERPEEFKSAINRRASVGDSQTLRSEGDGANKNCSTLRRYANDSFAHLSASDLDQHSLDWVVIGGESGPGARPFSLQWARDIIRQCRDAGAAPFFKQAGSNAYYEKEVGSAKGGCPVPLITKDSKGGNLDEIPFEDLRVREYAI